MLEAGLTESGTLGAQPGPSEAPQSASAPGSEFDATQGGGDMGLWSQIKVCGGKVSCWDPLTGSPLFDVTPEEAVAAAGEAEAEAKASMGRVSSRQLGSHHP